MSADVNVTEKAAEAILGAVFGQELPEAPIDLAVAALSALADPDVLAGMAEHLWDSVDDKGIRGRLYREDCDYLAAAVVEWITRRQP